MLTTKNLKHSLTSLALPIVLLASSSVSFAQQYSVTMRQYDNGRTGWNSHETILTPANVNSTTFGLQHSVTLDANVYAQPLIVPGINFPVNGKAFLHTVAYVATENCTVYAIDAKMGTILVSRNFGPPGTNPNGPALVGINSTGVIDTAAGTLYIMTYTQTASGPAYNLHALNLSTLADKVPPALVSASHMLTDGSTFVFSAGLARQRPALLLANGNIYAGWGGYETLAAKANTRGWVMGWQAGTLTPIAANQLFDTQATSPNNFFLASIWMSGAGLAADDEGNILFVTGNSDPAGTTYNGITDIQESVVKLSSDLTTVLDVFTPDNQPTLDMHDTDFGAGGVMVLPDQPGAIPHLAVAAGKDGNMYLMNEDSLGGHSSSTNNVLGTYAIGPCWCAESYFNNGKAFVVSSGGTQVMLWRVHTSPSPSLTLAKSSPVLPIRNGGFFTTVSSNGALTPIIWAIVVDPTSTKLSLLAFDPETGSNTVPMTQLFSAPAGTWQTGRAFLVPAVQNGRVFVVSYEQLQIFGPK
jgi:hypothetical protein